MRGGGRCGGRRAPRIVGGLRRGASPVDWLGRRGHVRHSCGSSEEQQGGSRRGRGDGAWRRAVWWAARAHRGSSVGSVAARLSSIGSGGAAFVRPPFVGQSRALERGKRRRGSTWDAAGKFRNGCNPTLRVGRREYKNCGSTTFLPILRVSSPAGSMRREAQSAAERRPARFAFSLRSAQRQSDPRDCGF